MKKRFFCLVCKSGDGSVYVSPSLLEVFWLLDELKRCLELGVQVVDVLKFDVDLSEYEL